MNKVDPIELLFGGMEKLGPGSKFDTLKVLDMLPKQPYPLIVDAGCGTGRQSLVLAKQLQTVVHAIDTYESFLKSLEQKANDEGVAHLIQTHCMDMADIPASFQNIDLLWSEAAAYSIGFSNALKIWHSAIRPKGFLVVSELCWLTNERPLQVKQFFESEYPDMQSTDAILLAIQDAGYKLLATHTLADDAWLEGFYDVLEPRAKVLLDHHDETVRSLAAEMLEEIRIFGCSEGSYGYVFYVLQNT